MGKSVVLNCDLCGTWDSKDVAVRTVNIAGPRFDLCAPCRVTKITEMGVPEVKARAYVETYDTRESTRGATLALNARTVKEHLRDLQQAPGADGGDPNQARLEVAGDNGDQELTADGEPLGAGPNGALPGAEDAVQDRADYADQVLVDLAAEAETEEEGSASRAPARRTGGRSRK